jgi:uncharacterized membrane protein (DUF485 family)
MSHQQTADRIQNNPKFHQLVKSRNSLATILSIAVLVLYFGFVLMIAFAPGVLTAPISETSVIPMGMLIGVGVIVASIILTGVYVNVANNKFDPLNDEIMREASK